MKHDQLCAIGHNLADSLASGSAFIIGYYPVDVFSEAEPGSGGIIEIDILHGRIVRGGGSEKLRLAVFRFAEVLPSFCRDSGVDVKEFKALSATFQMTALGKWVVLNVTDRTGKQSITEYTGMPLRRPRILDHLGRVRRIGRRYPATPANIER